MLGDAQDRVRELAGRRTVVDLVVQQLQIGHDPLQQIVEVMRDSSGELTDRLQPLGLAEFRFQLALGTDVEHGDDTIDDLAVRPPYTGYMQPCRENRAVLAATVRLEEARSLVVGDAGLCDDTLPLIRRIEV